jgi:alkaline phosphatase D
MFRRRCFPEFGRLAALISASFFIVTSALAARIVSGPMLGFQEHREVLIWVETEGAREVKLRVTPADQSAGLGASAQEFSPSFTTRGSGGTLIAHFTPGPLAMGAAFEYAILLDGVAQAQPSPTRFRTKRQWEWRNAPPDFSFLTGSCAYLNDPTYDRPGQPYGGPTEIFQHMANSGADFMLWLGDNLYYRESDYSSASGMWYRWQRDRATPDLQPLLAAMHHYAVWDDHDYGPNDSARDFPLKATALAAQKAYWGNVSYGEPDHPGAYGSFRHGDCLFVLLDNRLFRDASDAREPARSQLGARQMAWLRTTLINASAGREGQGRPSFIFICVGGQFVNESAPARIETFARYPADRNEILRVIREYDVRGVIFLTGDRHHTELLRLAPADSPAIYDLTSSPLTAGVGTSATREPEKTNPLRVPGTLVMERNYCQLALSGPRDDRRLTIQCRQFDGKKLWEHTLCAGEWSPAGADAKP